MTHSDSLRVSYVGMHTYRLSITEDLNQLPASTTPYQTTVASPYVDPRAPYRNWFELYSTFNAGRANYKALEVELRHTTTRGLYLNASYSLARNLADNQGDTPASFAGEVNYGIPVADRFHVGNNYGNVSGTRHNRALVSGAYQLPFGADRPFLHSGLLGKVIGGWEVNTVTLLETGPWLTPSISAGGCQLAVTASSPCPSLANGVPGTNDQSNTNVTNRGATLRPDVTSLDPYSGQSRRQFFSPAAFAATPIGAGRFGNAGVGILQGPGTIAVSFGTAKTVRLAESVKLRFESSFTNALNHTNFAPPATQIDNTSTFGVLSAAPNG